MTDSSSGKWRHESVKLMSTLPSTRSNPPSAGKCTIFAKI